MDRNGRYVTSKKKKADKSSNPTKAKHNTVKKNSKNENGEVTMQMHNNLKKAVNNFDEEVNQFATSYEKEQEAITGEVTDISEI